MWRAAILTAMSRGTQSALAASHSCGPVPSRYQKYNGPKACGGEVRGARWEEIDLEKGVWTVPAGRMKAGRSLCRPRARSHLDGAGMILEGGGHDPLAAEPSLSTR